MPLPHPLVVWGDAAEHSGPSVAAILFMRDAILRTEMSLRQLGSTVLMAAGSAPRRREVRDTIALAVDVSVGIRQAPLDSNRMFVCPAWQAGRTAPVAPCETLLPACLLHRRRASSKGLPLRMPELCVLRRGVLAPPLNGGSRHGTPCLLYF